MSETKTLHRNFWVWEFEKEERWLNEMAQEGWALQNAGFCTYTFEKTEPGQYIIRLAMLDSSPDFESFMGELEAQSVGHCFSWGYFRRSAQLGPFDMFSDVDSRISHLNKIGQMVRLLCLANLLIGVTNTFSGASLAWLNLLCATFFGLRAGMYQQQTRESDGRTSAPRVIFFSLMRRIFRVFKSSFLPACIPMQAGVLLSPENSCQVLSICKYQQKGGSSCRKKMRPGCSPCSTICTG